MLAMLLVCLNCSRDSHSADSSVPNEAGAGGDTRVAGGGGAGSGGVAGGGMSGNAGAGSGGTSNTSNGGATGHGGASVGGGTAGSGGVIGGGGNAGNGGSIGSGGAVGSGGVIGSGGSIGGAGVLGNGGMLGSGGSAGGGGVLGSGGKTGSGGVLGSGGSAGSSDTTVRGGTIGTGGAGGKDGGAGAGGGRGGGACQAGTTYATPVLTGTPNLISKPQGSSSGTYEGPVWLQDHGVLLFSDVTFMSGQIDPSAILQLTPPTAVQTFLQDSGTNGMAVDATGTVFACSHKVQGIVRLDFAAATLTTVVDNYNGKKFNSPNDLSVRSDGTIYFSDPDFQLGNRTSETGKKGIYRVTPAALVSVVDDTFNEPNGVALSPDESVLYVADYAADVVRTFSVSADGGTSNRKDFATVKAPDGFAVDCSGNLYVASGTSGTIVVFSPSGANLGKVTVAASVSNLAFGGSDGKTLYITAGKALYGLDMNLPGFYY